ncbi:MAG TPA: hypothetical protein VH637_09835 [Streptosporangiaceae bacterium]
MSWYRFGQAASPPGCSQSGRAKTTGSGVVSSSAAPPPCAPPAGLTPVALAGRAPARLPSPGGRLPAPGAGCHSPAPAWGLPSLTARGPPSRPAPGQAGLPWCGSPVRPGPGQAGMPVCGPAAPADCGGRAADSGGGAAGSATPGCCPAWERRGNGDQTSRSSVSCLTGDATALLAAWPG